VTPIERQDIIHLCQAAICARRGEVTLVDRLDELACRFGLHATRQVSIALPGERGSRATAEIMGRSRSDLPDRLGDRPVSEVHDLLAGKPPNSDVLVLGCEDGTRVVVRPSGTEPKLEIYLQVVLPMQSPQRTRLRSARELDAIERQVREIARL
jgi:phosphomannomutase